MQLVYLMITAFYLTIHNPTYTGPAANQIEYSREVKDNILDYYLKIPATAILCDDNKNKDSKDYRIESIVKMDIRNGYLLARYNDFLWMQVALFTQGEKKVIATVANCGMGCMCNEKIFYEVLADGSLKDITAEIIPPEYMDAGWFILPEIGTTISIYDYDLLDGYDFKEMTKTQKKALTHELIWTHGQFKLKN